MSAPIVTLTTDWGTRDYFAARVKGRLCCLISDVRIIDLSHEQTWNDMVTLMQLIRQGCLSFPAGTIHIIDAGCDPTQRELTVQEGVSRYLPQPVLVQYHGQYLISSEMRPLSWALEEAPDKAVWLPLPEGSVSYTFLAYDLFCGVAAALAQGADVLSLGQPVEMFKLLRSPMTPVDGTSIAVAVTAIDKYGNAILNVRYDDFEAARAGRRFTASIDNRTGIGVLRTVSRHYNDVRMGNLLLTVSHTGYLQLAVNAGSAAQLLGLRPMSLCHIVFYD